MKEQTNDLFFVEIRQHSEIRKDILEALKQMLEVLQRFEKFRHIRHSKSENIQKLKAMIKDANKVLGTLKGKLPQTNLRVSSVREDKPAPKKIHKKNKPAPQKKEPKREMTEMERLEAELNAIESKLKSLD
ncbi:hypothetical protein HYS31_00640 [Candidatus Woesearchaeota archaeon]|nr:hypothetical protein [Candidatus Woesearchaeota archaeon]